MYTVTFYSFKGGVGRTMALVNVAFQLAQQSRSVMMIDFDLEAPGLDAFLKPYGSRPSRGLVDFVTEYRETGQPPDVSDYVYQVGSGSMPKAWFMPAGRRAAGYGARLHAIDWRKLYEEEDGFLLFEDLKAQWQQAFQPDYVFLDSRTGHTDVGGICTRQLPDAVVLLFRLDEQNLTGLQRVVEEIREEGEGPRKKDIKLHFVPSNVPRMDDEHNVLSDQIKKFEGALDFAASDVRIQHYDDMEMLQHTVFTLTRRNTRITHEYEALAKEIARYNIEDVKGARDYLKNLIRNPRGRLADAEERVGVISIKHRHDLEVLELLADLRLRQGKLGQALAYLTEAINTGSTKSSHLIRRAELNHRLGDNEATVSDLRHALNSKIQNYFEISRLLNIARRVDRSILDDLPMSKAVKSLDLQERKLLCDDLLSDDADKEVALKSLKLLLDEPGLETEGRAKVIELMALPLISTGRYSEVVELLQSPTTIRDYFNLAMARWAESREAPIDLFRKVVKLDEESTKKNESANYSFCLAIAKSVLGARDEAMNRIAQSKQAAREEMGRIFSPWTYKYEGTKEFFRDLEEAESLIEEERLLPAFFSSITQSNEDTHA